jgi:putative transcriptional regulator
VVPGTFCHQSATDKKLKENMQMSYKPIKIDRQNLTLMGIPFPDEQTLNSAANAIGSNMFEGFEPTSQIIQFYLDWKTGKVLETDFLSKLESVVGLKSV